MFDFTVHRPPVWPEHLRPTGGDYAELVANFASTGHIHGSFVAWWSRVQAELGHLHPVLAEQWVHKHWGYSRFMFLPLETLRWELQTMTGEDILATVRREFETDLDPERDYRFFQDRSSLAVLGGSFDYLPTAAALDRGTWDFPIIVLSTPSGWRSPHGDFPETGLVLVEGHKRHRYLNALHAKGIPPEGPHKVFVISSPLVEEENHQ